MHTYKKHPNTQPTHYIGSTAQRKISITPGSSNLHPLLLGTWRKGSTEGGCWFILVLWQKKVIIIGSVTRSWARLAETEPSHYAVMSEVWQHHQDKVTSWCKETTDPSPLTKVTTPFMARVLDGVLYLMTLTFESVDEILWCHHSNESSLPVLSYGAICLSKFYKIKFGNLVEICLWPHLEVKGLQSNLYIVVTLYIRDTRILPKIFSCLIYFLQSWP